MEHTPVQIGQFILGKNLGIGAFGKVRTADAAHAIFVRVPIWVRVFWGDVTLPLFMSNSTFNYCLHDTIIINNYDA
eukprot:scaffold13869_cov69-Attheya_sp.AAC.4